MTAVESVPLQHRGWLPSNACYGCGPDNPHGLQVRSLPGDDGALHAIWQPEPHMAGPPGAVNGGLLAAPMDCHGNWVAMRVFRERAEAAGGDPDGVASVTGEYSVRLSAPTPVEGPVELRAELDRLDGRKAFVTVTASVAGTLTATFRGTFFEVAADRFD